MPGNGVTFEAFTLSTGCVKREWFQTQTDKKFRIWAIDQSQVYHVLNGNGWTDTEVFKRVVETLNYCINEELLT